MTPHLEYSYVLSHSYTLYYSMRFLTTLLVLALAIPALADRSKWVELASKSKNGIIKLDSASYDELLSADRDYSALVLLTALAPQFKCEPCQ